MAAQEHTATHQFPQGKFHTPPLPSSHDLSLPLSRPAVCIGRARRPPPATRNHRTKTRPWTARDVRPAGPPCPTCCASWRPSSASWRPRGSGPAPTGRPSTRCASSRTPSSTSSPRRTRSTSRLSRASWGSRTPSEWPWPRPSSTGGYSVHLLSLKNDKVKPPFETELRKEIDKIDSSFLYHISDQLSFLHRDHDELRHPYPFPKDLRKTEH